MTDYTEVTKAVREFIGDGQIFGCEFEKRDGTIRTGSFRLGVRKDLKGVGAAYDRDARGNLTVFDMTKQAYRTIRLDSVIAIRAHGTTITASNIVDDVPVSGDDEWGNR